MKIINEGVKPEPAKPWYTGLEMDCRYCGFVGVTEQSDIDDGTVTIVEGRYAFDRRQIHMVCPTCGGAVVRDYNSKPIFSTPI